MRFIKKTTTTTTTTITMDDATICALEAKGFIVQVDDDEIIVSWMYPEVDEDGVITDGEAAGTDFAEWDERQFEIADGICGGLLSKRGAQWVVGYQDRNGKDVAEEGFTIQRN